jgi:hypothetical protein
MFKKVWLTEVRASGELAASVQHHGKRPMWLALYFFLKLDKLLKNKQNKTKLLQ